ncbi:MAG: lipase [Acidobacteriia bacterium]|nr:lipase [Terriglobia bacterium]
MRRRLCAATAIGCIGLATLLGEALAQGAPAVRLKPWGVRGTLPLSKFYDTPAPLPAGKPGELIRSERFDDYDLPDEVSAIRILYHTRSATGEDVAVSGVVLVPDRRPPAGGWPVIAWAHGFSGAARSCAPSLRQNLEHGPFLSMYVNLGYAVVATDYAGLGTNFRNAAIDMDSNATDVINVIPAARAAAPALGPRWIAMGTAEGSLAAVAVAELEGEIRDPNYLGSVAISGVDDVKNMYERLALGPSYRRVAWLAYGVKTVYPQFQVSDMIAAKGLTLYDQIEKTCAGPEAGPEIRRDEMVKLDWEQNRFVQQFFSRNTAGLRRAFGPLLVISSAGDPAAPAAAAAQVVARMCRQGDRVQFYTFPGSDPGQVVGDSVQDQIAWIEARFAGRTAPGNCH